MNRSFWEDTLYKQQVDLLVIGAGITGQSAAHFYKLANPGARVLVLDRGIFPAGASTRNAGFACIGSIGEFLADLEIDSEEKLKNRIRERYEGLQLLRKTLGDTYIDFEHCGGFELFTDPKELQVAEAQINRFNEWMVELIGEKDVFKNRMYRGRSCIFNRVEGMLHPGKMMKRLYELNVQAGIEYRWSSLVSELDVENNAAVTAGGLEVHADGMVIATNAFTEQLLPGYSIEPGRGYVFVTNELNSAEWKGTFHFNKGYVYFRNLGAKRVLLGGGRNIDRENETTPDFGFNASIKNYLIEFADEVLGLPPNWQIEREWSGIMGFTASKSADMEQIGKNCVLAAGLSGMGVALGMKLGKMAAETL